MLNIVERKNKDNQTYIDCVKWLLRYLEIGGFHIREDKSYGYLVFIEKKDKDADCCNGDLISITELGIHIKSYKGKDNNDCHTFEGWKMFCNYDFSPANKDYEFSHIKYFIHSIENNWPEIALKKLAVADKKLDIEKDFV